MHHRSTLVTTLGLGRRVRRGAHADALVTPNVALAADGIFTAFAIGSETGAGMNPLQGLLCADAAPANGLPSTCAVAN